MILHCRDIQNRSHNTQSRAQAGLLRSGDSGFRIPVCRAKLAHTNRRLDKALSRREEADRLKGMAIRQAAAASGRVAKVEQHGVMFAEQVREEVSSSAPASPAGRPALASSGSTKARLPRVAGVRPAANMRTHLLVIQANGHTGSN